MGAATLPRNNTVSKSAHISNTPTIPETGMSTEPQAIRNYTDEMLVALFTKDNNSEAIEELINRYSDKIMRLALRITRDEKDAEDILQNVFLTLLSKLHTFRGESKFSSRLYRITLNAIYMHLGVKNSKTNREISLEDYAPYNESGKLIGVSEKNWSTLPDDALLSIEGIKLIEQAIADLPEKYRVVFHLGDIEGLPDQEVANVLGLSLSATKSRKRRARLFLRDKLSDYFYEWQKGLNAA